MTAQRLRPIAFLTLVACSVLGVAAPALAQGGIVQPKARPFAYANDRYQLVERTGVITADVYFRSGQMIVNDANGTQYVFVRDRQFDSLDRKYAGYFLPTVNRVVRFPRSGSGMMLVADLDDVYPRFVFSRRSVRRAGKNPTPFVPPYFVSPYATPAPGYGPPPAIGPYGGGPVFPILRPRLPLFPPPMQSITLESRVVPRDPLPPATVRLANTARREIRVTINDAQNPTQPQQLRIAPGSSETVRFARDAGGDHVRRVQTFAPDGSVITRDLSTPIAPTPRYELVVHEWKLQSVAIDRTGKSPNVIEDTNFQGKGMGRFLLPPGDQLKSGTMDVVRTALEARNAGSVSPLLDDSGRTPETPRGSSPVSPLEQMLIEQQKARGGR